MPGARTAVPAAAEKEGKCVELRKGIGVGGGVGGVAGVREIARKGPRAARKGQLVLRAGASAEGASCKTHGSAFDGSFQGSSPFTGGGSVAALGSPDGNKRSNTSAPFKKHLKVEVKATEAFAAAHGKEK
jgi:hypothetical protein